MFLLQLNSFLQQAGTAPSFFWEYQYFLARKSFAQQLERIADQVQAQNSKEYENVQRAIHVFQKDACDETELANVFGGLADVFVTAGLKNEHLQRFQELTDIFVKRVQRDQVFADKRTGLRASQSADEQQALTHRLFCNEGISYCMEFYLAVYKQLSDLPDETGKMQFLQAKEIDLGHGTLPGLHHDLTTDESLTKFILLILDDTARDRLVRSYYKFKLSVHEQTSATVQEESLREFLIELLVQFQQQGIHQLTSNFLQPYGNKPFIDELVTKLSNVGN